MRVTNMYQAQQNVSRVQTSAQNVFKSDYQVATGLKSENYSDVADDLSQILSTKETQKQLEDCMNTIQAEREAREALAT